MASATASAAPLPERIEHKLETAPHFLDKRGLAQLFTELFGPISYRTIEGRPLVWRIHNGRAVTETRAAVEAEYARFVASPEYRVGGAKKTA
jgi:hypothetical protein